MISIKEKILYSVFGAGFTLASMLAYNILTGPDFAYKHRHFGDPNKFGQTVIDLKGARFTDSNFAGGNEDPQTFETMIEDALKHTKKYDLLRKAGINPEDGISELKIEVKK